MTPLQTWLWSCLEDQQIVAIAGKGLVTEEIDLLRFLGKQWSEPRSAGVNIPSGLLYGAFKSTFGGTAPMNSAAFSSELIAMEIAAKARPGKIVCPGGRVLERPHCLYLYSPLHIAEVLDRQLHGLAGELVAHIRQGAEISDGDPMQLTLQLQIPDPAVAIFSGIIERMPSSLRVSTTPSDFSELRISSEHADRSHSSAASASEVQAEHVDTEVIEEVPSVLAGALQEADEIERQQRAAQEARARAATSSVREPGAEECRSPLDTQEPVPSKWKRFLDDEADEEEDPEEPPRQRQSQ
jgi:hypothetical protein